MARRRQQLQHRIAYAGSNQARAMGSYHPVGTSATPMVMPLAQVVVSPSLPGYVTVGYRGVDPIWAPDGGTIPATSPGRWAQLVAAGRP